MILPLPPTTNSTYRHVGHRVFMTREAKVWVNEALWLLKTAQKPLHEPTELFITYYLKRDRDVDGSHKIIIDTLQKAGWFANDSVLTDLHLHKEFSKDPRVEITW